MRENKGSIELNESRRGGVRVEMTEDETKYFACFRAEWYKYEWTKKEME